MRGFSYFLKIHVSGRHPSLRKRRSPIAQCDFAQPFFFINRSFTYVLCSHNLYVALATAESVPSVAGRHFIGAIYGHSYRGRRGPSGFRYGTKCRMKRSFSKEFSRSAQRESINDTSNLRYIGLQGSDILFV